VVWTDAPLDWMVAEPAALRHVGATIEALAQEWQADLLHLNLPSQAAGLRADWPVVVAAHSCLPTWWRAVRGDALPDAWQWHRHLNAAGFERADAVVVPSAGHGASLNNVYGNIGRLHVVHNAAWPHAEISRPRDPYVLAAGRWWDDGKNGAVLDAAASETQWPVLMAGPTAGPDGTRLTLRHARGLGALQNPALAALMQRAAVFASASIYEPFGLAVLEAAWCGAALVLSDIPTFRELWDGAAVFVPPRHAAAYAAAFASLAAAPAWRETLGQLARARAAQFTPERQATKMLGVYDAALAHQRSRVREVA
jgi:glycosyltransferase involved in cell wall biosynthesis